MNIVLKDKMAAVISEKSDNNVELWKTENGYAVKCRKCFDCSTWIGAFIDLDVPVIPAKVIEFCKNHKHINEELEVSTTWKYTNGDPLVWKKEKVKSNVIDITTKNPILFAQAGIMQEVKEDDTMNLLGDIQINIGNRITAVSPAILKWVARLSDFNVDIQANRTKYRLLCSKCSGEKALTRDEVLTMDRDGEYPEIIEFLMQHRHDKTTTVAEGRKFR